MWLLSITIMQFHYSSVTPSSFIIFYYNNYCMSWYSFCGVFKQQNLTTGICPMPIRPYIDLFWLYFIFHMRFHVLPFSSGQIQPFPYPSHSWLTQLQGTMVGKTELKCQVFPMVHETCNSPLDLLRLLMSHNQYKSKLYALKIGHPRID